MLPKPECNQNRNNRKLIFHQNWNVTKTEMSLKLKYHQKFCQKLDITKTELAPKHKCHQNWNVPTTEMSPKGATNGRPGCDYVIWGPMRGLQNVDMKGGQTDI